MRREYPEEYDFFPMTFVLPQELHLFKSQFTKNQQNQPQSGKKAEK